MSDKKIKTQESKTFVQRVLAKFEANEEDKLTTYVSVLARELDNRIKSLETNKLVMETKHKRNIERQVDKLDDFKQEIEESYINIELEGISNKTACNDYVSRHMDKINKAEYNLKEFVETCEEYMKEYVSSIKDIDEQIAKYKQRLEKISN